MAVTSPILDGFLTRIAFVFAKSLCASRDTSIVAMPYRADAKAALPSLDESERGIFVIAAVLWAASIARVAFAFVRHETFGAIATLALVFVVAIPIAALRRHKNARGLTLDVRSRRSECRLAPRQPRYRAPRSRRRS